MGNEMSNNLVAVEKMLCDGFVPSDDLLHDAKHIVETAQISAYRVCNSFLVQRNWLLGRRIAVEELADTRRKNYGREIVKKLAAFLTEEFGSGFDQSSLYKYVRFYKLFPKILDSSSPKSLLSWTHYRFLIQVDDAAARDWYAEEAAKENWSVETLKRNIWSQYYYRLLSVQKNTDTTGKIDTKEREYNSDTYRLEFIKNPVIAEFLGLSQAAEFNESNLETAIISNLQKFLMELGKGYAFVARQQRICTEKEDYFIDLVFYNYILKCFILIDLKTTKITHQDVGQMDMYVRMYDDLKRSRDDNPTLGILLCSETDEDIARYSVLHGNEQLFASKYKLYLPSEEQLRSEIEAQKHFYLLQRENRS